MTPDWKPNAQTVVSCAGSSLTLGERVTRTQIERGEIVEMERRAMWYPRGAFGVGRYAGFRVVQASVVEERGNIGLLTVNWEVNPDFGGGTVTLLPPDDFDIKPFAHPLPVRQNPAFSAITRDYYDLVEAATKGSDRLARDMAIVQLGSLFADDDPIAEAALELVNLIDQGIETYYSAGLVYEWYSYSWTYPDCVLGGSIESPGGPGVNLLPAGASWLREIDVPTRENGYHKLTRTWRGATTGNWKAVLYP